MNLRTKIIGGLMGLAALAGVAATLAHAATLRTQINHAIVSTYTGTNDFGSPSFQLQASAQPVIQLSTGTGSNQANAIFADQRTLSASATEGLDLYGSLTDPLGGTLNFATIKAIKICAASANTNNVNFGPGIGNTATAFPGPMQSNNTSYSSVRPGGCALHVAPQTGWTVTNATQDILPIGNSGGSTSVTYDIVILGTQ
jgi:hypothetical protein